MPVNVAIAPASSLANLVDDPVERERLVAEQERSAGDGRDQRDLVTVGERPVAGRVFLVDRVEQPVRLVAEAERGPDLGDGRGVDLALRPAGPLTEPGEQADTDSHANRLRGGGRGLRPPRCGRAGHEASILPAWRRRAGARRSAASR